MDRDAKRWPDDHLRPLSARGMARASKAAAGLRQLTARPELVLASPLLRAQQTAQILERYARWPRAQVCVQLTPDTSTRELLGHLGRIGVHCLAVIGHEPQLSALLGRCLPGGVERDFALRKMGATLVRFRGRARPGRGQLVWFAPPRLLRAVRRGRPD